MSLAERHRAKIERVADSHAVPTAGTVRRVGRVVARTTVEDRRRERLRTRRADGLEVAACDGDPLDGDGEGELRDVDGSKCGELPSVVVADGGAVLAGGGLDVVVVAEGDAGEEAAVEVAAVVDFDAVLMLLLLSRVLRRSRSTVGIG